jgi:hypothetical protein
MNKNKTSHENTNQNGENFAANIENTGKTLQNNSVGLKILDMKTPTR